ncbi:Uncharacterized protein APZ42_002745 [Daphnia magna]|uniref:Uncharacterized protein n=1 Tax=Daphnia magna TaxID=35525 RepID=A0A164I2G3_9CRUS|nr:Uncharacterized protein APZ42_002745 [Daphnia magna]
MALNSQHLQVPLIVGFISNTKACLPLYPFMRVRIL